MLHLAAERTNYLLCTQSVLPALHTPALHYRDRGFSFIPVHIKSVSRGIVWGSPITCASSSPYYLPPRQGGAPPGRVPRQRAGRPLHSRSYDPSSGGFDIKPGRSCNFFII